MHRLYHLTYDSVPLSSIKPEAYRQYQLTRLALNQALSTYHRLYCPKVGPQFKEVFRSLLRSNETIYRLRHSIRVTRNLIRSSRNIVRCTLSRPSHSLSVAWEGSFDSVHHDTQYYYTQLKRDLRTLRTHAKRPLMVTYDYWRLSGGVHITPADVLNRVKTVKKSRVFKTKRPKTVNRHVSVEIEFCCSHDDEHVSDAIVEHDLQDYVQLKSDGSVTPDRGEIDCSGDCCDDQDEEGNCQGECSCTCRTREYGHELAVCMPETIYPEIVKRTCRMLKTLGAYVNKTCGLHVHLDMRGRDAAKVYRNLFNAQGLLLSLVSKSRRQNTYCRPIEHGDLDSRPNDRYRTVNATALDEHTTIEVRLHSGTVLASKINHWISLLIKLTNARRVLTNTNTVERACLSIRIGARLKAYLSARITEFAGNAEERRVA